MTELRYTVPGRPITWARPRLDGRKRGRRPHILTDDSQRAAKAAHAMLARVALRGRTWDLDGAFEIEVIGYWPDAVVGDSDRLTSLALDALEGVAYRADRQVRRQSGSVATDHDRPRTEVVLRRLAVDPVQKKPRKR